MKITTTSKKLPLIALMLLLTVSLAACRGGKPEEEGDKKADSEQSEQKKDDKEEKGDKKGFGKDGKDKKPEAVPVEVVAAIKRTVSASYAGTANLEAPADAQVVAKTSGVLQQLLVEEGQYVRAGQTIARLDNERQRLEMVRAEANMRKLENNNRRARELASNKLISAEQGDQIRFDYESAKAAYQLAKLELSYTNISAPISGVIAQRIAKQGNLIQMNAPVYRIVDTSRLEAVLSVPEREMSRIKQGMPVTLLVDALPGQFFNGSIDRVAPVVDIGSGTFRVVCAFESDSALRAGMFGRMNVVYEQRDNALTIPRTALLEDEGEPAVYVVREKKAVRVPLKLGFVNGEIAEVVSGLKAGDQVVTAGKVAIRDGSEVQVIVPGAPEPAEQGKTSTTKAASN
jgi:membrane fusion protein, multidrug efflux system